MSNLEYHYGIKMQIYPDYHQRQLIELNGNISRTVYNKLVGIDKELYQLKKTKHHDDYFKLIDLTYDLSVLEIGHSFVLLKKP